MSRSRSFWLRAASCVVLMMIANTAMVLAQPGQGPGPGGGFRGFGGGGGFGGPMMLLGRQDVQEELELLDDQKTQLRDITEKSRERMAEVFRTARGGEGGGDFRETFRKFNEEVQAEVDKILLPHQSKRLKQLEVQMRMRGALMGALSGDVAEQLGISEDQQDKLREKAQGLEQELRKKMTEIRKQMQEQLLADLSPDQRKQFNEMVGEPFEFRDEPPQGGPGGPGGGFRGRDGGRPDGNREQGRGPDRRRRPE